MRHSAARATPPILGADICVVSNFRATGSTGRSVYNCIPYLIVENVRRGMRPNDAGPDASS